MWVLVWILVYEGHGFESTSWFLGDVGLSLQLFGGGCGFESKTFFGGGRGGGGCGFESTSLFFWGGEI